jgi:RHS repeat-associated protein
VSGAPSGVGNPYFFTGREHDAETGLYNYRTRYLDPAAGRFTSRDAIGVWGDVPNAGNATAYVASNPANRADPLGLEGCTFEQMGETVTMVGYSTKYENCTCDDRKIKVTHSVEVAAEGSIGGGAKGVKVGFKISRSEKFEKEEEITVKPCKFKQFKYTFSCTCKASFVRGLFWGFNYGLFYDAGYWDCTQEKDTLIEGAAECDGKGCPKK